MSTNVQYLPWDSFTLANFKTWGQAIGTALTAFGWSLDGTVNGTVNWSTLVNWPGQFGFTSTVINAIATTTSRGAFVNTNTYSTNDYVTFNGATWICVSAYTSTATTPTPGNDIGSGLTQHWALWCFEIWKSAVTPTMYIRFEYYGFASSTNAGIQPQIRVIVGTSDDTSANLGVGAGNVRSSGFVMNTTQVSTLALAYGNNYPCYFSGDTGNRLAMLMWDDIDDAQGTSFFCVERSLSNAGAYYTTPSGAVTPYWTIISASYANSFTSQALINTTGSTWIQGSQDSQPWALNANLTHNGQVEAIGTGTGMGIGNQSFPALPVFPMVGWVGNPMTTVMSFKTSDAPHNGEYTISLYGTSRTYYATKNSIFANFGGSTNNGLALRFD
jgi:hypothetical protein